MNAPLHRVVTVLALCSLLVGCTTSTGEKVKLTRNQLTPVKKLGVAATAEKPFQVRFSRDEAGSAGAMVGALTFGLSGAVVGSTIEAGAKSTADSKKTKSLAEALAEFNGPGYLQDQVAQRLTNARVFASVARISTNEVSALKTADAALVLTLREWGLRRQQAGGTNELLQIGFDVNVRLVKADGKPLWERDDFFLDGKGTSLAQFRDTPGLLIERLSAALDAYSGRLVNQLRYID